MKIQLTKSLIARVGLAAVAAGSWLPALIAMNGGAEAATKEDPYVLVAYNDLGMHCMNEDFSELCILPPFNNLHVQIIQRGHEPRIIRNGFLVGYSIPGNTVSHTKTNFWQFAPQLFGVTLPNDVGLTGNQLAGRMVPNAATRDWVATGIPVTPLMDDMTLNAYPFAKVTIRNSRFTGTTSTVIPVSWEISCNLCHQPSQGTVANDILEAHDRLHGTDLVHQKPVLCAGCHSDPALGTTGVPGVKSMSAAMHGAHAPRMSMISIDNECYACHPGIETNCQRDVHFSNGVFCNQCHGGMEAVGSTTRTPWRDEPKCSDCHNVAGHDYEEPGKLYKESRGHGGVLCATCHQSPHVIAPSTNPADNAQAIKLQGMSGTLRKCSVCHIKTPEDPFFHTIEH